ncbi:MAG: PilZ domain-containing protein [Nitrospirae bacterium]|nr:MAG: PilZ domain-containing protein [Nitrospirota bacterium]
MTDSFEEDTEAMGRALQRRASTRVRVMVEAELKAAGSVKITGCLGNVSLHGMFLSCDARLPIGTPCLANILLSGTEPPITIHARGTVVRHEVSGMAIHFTEIVDEESLVHLQRLLLFNSGQDVEAIEREIHSASKAR